MADDEDQQGHHDGPEKNQGPQGVAFIDGPGPAVKIGLFIGKRHGAAVHSDCRSDIWLRERGGGLPLRGMEAGKVNA